MNFSQKIAVRYLWCKRRESFISVITIISILGVAIGVMVLNIVMSIMTGFETELKEKILGANSHIVVKRTGGRIEHYEEIAERIRSIDGVVGVSPFTYNQGLLRTDTGSTGILIRGIGVGSPAAQMVASYIEPGGDVGALFNPPSVDVEQTDGSQEMVRLPGLVVGKELARSLNLFVGQAVSMLSPNVGSTPFGLMPKYRRFVVSAIYSSGLIEYESGLAYADIKETQQFFGLGGAATGIEVQVRDLSTTGTITPRILDLLGGLSEGFYVQDWTEINRPLWDALRLEKRVYFIVLLLLIVMASFSIISTLVMIVLEKRKDIAVLKTLGASSKAISSIFRFQGAVIGGIGTLLGLCLGLVGCLALRTYGFPLDERIFQMSTVPVRIEPFNFLIVGVCAFLICLFATMYPARRASRLDPIESLRYE